MSDSYSDFIDDLRTAETMMMVMTNVDGNNNKFYEAILNGDSVNVRFGRVGADGQRTTYAGGRSMFQRKLTEKWKKGYRPVDVATSAKAQATGGLKDLAAKTLVTADSASDPKIASLIDYLVAKNAHDIGAASGGKIKVLNGQVQTPLGLLTQSTITKARATLGELQGATNGERTRLLESYLMLVPQDIGRTRGWQDYVLTKPEQFFEQSQFLDQLEASLDVAKAQAKANEGNEDETVTDLFRFKVKLLTDDAEFARIEKKYRGTANSRHGYGVNNAKVRAVYALTDSKRSVPFDQVAKEIGNVQELWHGSRAHNILSILSKGLFIPPRHGSGIHIAGRMFGNGIYFSNQSTKSANYSRGGVWSSGSDNRWFMLVADVAMGNEYRPEKDPSGNFGHGSDRWEAVYSGKKLDAKGRRFHSVNVRPGTNNVQNHEAIVANLDQINIKYLVEFEG